MVEFNQIHNFTTPLKDSLGGLYLQLIFNIVFCLAHFEPCAFKNQDTKNDKEGNREDFVCTLIV